MLFGKATQQLVFIFQLQQGLGDNLRDVGVEETTAARLNQWLEKLKLLDIPEPAGFVVRGTVKSADKQPLTGAVVLAFELDMRKEQLLGEAKTDDLGQYIIRYSAKEFSTGDVPSAIAPKLIVRAFVGGQQIGNDVIPPTPTRDELINFQVPAPVLSEWEQVTIGVMPLLAGQGEGDQMLPPWEINGSDLNFIAEETGLEREKIRLWALAFAVGRDALEMQPAGPIRSSGPMTHLPVIGTAGDLSIIAVFYGWFRQGLPTDLAELWSRSTDSLITEFKKSIEANLVPRILSDQLVVLETTINQLKAARVLVPAPEGKPSSLGDLLGTLPPNEALSNDQQLIFATLRNEHGDTDNLWKQAEASGLSKAIPALKRTIALGELTEGHTLLVNALQTKIDAMRPESVEFLTALEPINWIELVFEHGVPPGSGLDRDGYIAQLQDGVESKFPMRMLSKQLERKLSESERFPTRKVLQFLEVNPDFDLKTQHVEPFLSEKGDGDDHLREGLLQLQRIHVLTSNARETGVLLDAGYGSASQIIHGGRPAFETKVAKQLSPERQEAVFAAAEVVVTYVAVVATTYVSPSASGNAVYVIPAPSVSPETLEKYPSLRSLFGDLDYCECRHCQSVLGPAAYLTDLMHFLQRSKLIPNPGVLLEEANLWSTLPYLELEVGRTVLGVLLQRRPDLADLELSCENTDTKIPYIDLVLEILENAVTLPLPVVIKDVAAIDIDAEFAAGRVPVQVAAELRKTAIKVGKTLTVSDSPYQDPSNSLFIYLDWIITDGSRRWLVKHWKQQFIFGVPGVGSFRSHDITSAVDSLKNGTLSAELEDSLSQGLPIYGTPQIDEISVSSTFGNVWRATYTRAIAIRITMGSPMGAVELLKLDGTQWKPPRQWQSEIIQVINHAFTPDTTSKIDPNVAQLLELPANEIYFQTWNTTRNWWELSVKNTSTFIFLLEGLYISGLTYQNSSIREHLTSSPENRNPAAYEKLSKDAVYPWALPFDLWLEETRAFLDALGVPRAQLIDMARPQSRLSEEAATLELLGLSKSEADLITPATASTVPWTYWGLAEKNNTVKDHTAGSGWSGGWQEVLAHLSMLLQQSGLSYREYLDLLQTSFVGQPKLILLPPNECKTSMIILFGLNELEFTDHLNRIHVFTRLWRKSGWSMRDLGLALAAFGGQITPTILEDLALLKRLSAGLGLPVSVLAGCVGTLETQTWTNHTKDGSPIEPALYNSVFQRQSLRSLIGFDDFALEKLGKPTLSISAPPLFSEGDFIDVSCLTAKLTRSDPISQYLWNQLSATDQQVLSNATSTALQQKTVLIAALNQVLRGASIYQALRFGGIPLSEETLVLASQNPTGADLIRLNRLFLQDAYPGEIKQPGISPREAFIAASLGIKPDQVKTWITGTSNLGIADQANLDSLSRLYAAASLCRALCIAPDALPDVVTLLGAAADPFSTLPPPTTPDEIAQQVRLRAHAMLEFVERIDFVRKSGFDFETLSYLFRHRVLPGKGSDASTRVEQQLTQALTELRSALQSGVVLGDVSADNLKRQLARLGWYPALINEAMGSESISYQPGASVKIKPPLAVEPAIPLNLRVQFTYRKIDNTEAVLECSGSLKDADFTSIGNLFPGSATVTDLKTKYQTQLDDQTKVLASLLQIIELTELPKVTETLTGPTVLPVIPGELKDRLKFEMTSATEGNLNLTGWLSDAEKKAVINANGSSTFSVDDLVGLPSLASKLKQPGRPVDTWIAGRLSAATKAALANYQGAGSDPTPLQTALLQDLNSALGGSSIYEPQRFAGVVLRSETQKLLSQNPRGDDLVPLNRLLLEDTYPLELSRNHANPLLSAVVISLQAKALLEIPTPSSQTSKDAEQLLREPDVEKRYRTILLRLVSRLDLDLLLTQLSVSLGLDQQIVDRLLDTAKVNALSAKDLLTDSDFLRSDSKNLLKRKTDFSLGDLKDFPGLVGRLSSVTPDALSAYLWANIPPVTQTQVQDTALSVNQRKSVLVGALNFILQSTKIYNPARFSAIPLSPEAKALVAQDPTGSDLVRLNRILLAEAYPLEIASTGETWPHQFAVLELLGKIATIVNRLTIKPEQLDWILGDSFAVMDVLALPTSATNATNAATSFDGWRQLVDLFHLRDVLPDGPARLTRIYTALKTSDFARVRKELAEAYELNLSEVDEVSGACSADLLSFKDTASDKDYNNPTRLLALAQLLHVIKALGTTSVDITQLILPEPDQSVAQLARSLFEASTNADEFPERLRPISNRLRNLQRDALVAYLIHHDHLADSNELFDRYLIDVEMGSCMLTSRIKQAISSVQLFVQRCLLNLERPVTDINGVELKPGDSPDSIDTQRWQWMKYYRVWEANRKVFLYPENWIEPELRDDKTEIFRAFESDLQQSELTHDSALVAFRKYLDKMADIANLTVVSMFEEQLRDDNGNVVKTIVHLVGRDNSTPYKHYYRQWKLRSTTDFGTWTAWEELSIQADSEHILVFLFGGSIYLAWPTISSGQKGNLNWKIGMNLAKRSAAGWTKLKKGRGEIETPMVPLKDESTSLAFQIKYNNLDKPDETVSIESYGWPYQEPGEEPKETKQETISDDHDDKMDVAVDHP